MEEDAWYILREHSADGPFTWANLKLSAAGGSLKPYNLVRQGRQGEWGPANKLPGLFEPEKPPSRLSDEDVLGWLTLDNQ
jgi:hypothetical protein